MIARCLARVSQVTLLLCGPCNGSRYSALKLCNSEKIHTQPMEFPGGRGCAKPKPSMGWGGGEDVYFLELHKLYTVKNSAKTTVQTMQSEAHVPW